MKTVWPILERELRVAARRPATWRTRMSVAAAAIALSGYALFQIRAVAPSEMGSAMFAMLNFVTGLGAILMGPFLAADCLSRERREGTLGLLFLTDLGGWDVVLGKLTAAAWSAGYALFAVIPVLGMTVLLGGVTLTQVGLLTVALLNGLLLSLAVGVFTSSFCKDARQASGLATSAVLGLAAIPWATFAWLTSREHAWSAVEAMPVLLPSPVLPTLLIFGRLVPLGVPVPAAAFPVTIAFQQALTWLLLWIAAVRVRTVWQEKGEAKSQRGWRGWWHRLRYGGPERRLAVRRKLLGHNPFLWLAQREVWKPTYPWLLIGALLIVFLVQIRLVGVHSAMDFAVLFLVTPQFLFAVWFAGESAQRLCDERHSGALELLLTTPLNERDILAGQSAGLRRLFLYPLVLMAALDFAGFVKVGFAEGWPTMDSPSRYVLFAIGWYFRSLIAIRWLATWLALRGAAVNTASTLALALGLLVPLGFGFSATSLLEWESQELRILHIPHEWLNWIFHGLVLVWIETALRLARRAVLRNFRLMAIRPLRPVTERSRWSWLRSRTPTHG
jgi:hypothetical protein